MAAAAYFIAAFVCFGLAILIYLALPDAVLRPIIAIPLVIPGVAAALNGLRRDRESIQSVIARDTRPLVVYCRPFRLDTELADSDIALSLIANRFPHSLFMRPRFMVNSESILGPVARKLGPYVAIGDPKEDYPALGAHRLYCSGDEWKHAFEVLVDGACAIIAAVPSTESVLWEINAVVRKRATSKLFVVFCPDARDAEEEFQRFRSVMHGVLPLSTAEKLGEARVLHFRANEIPVLSAPSSWLHQRLYHHETMDALFRAFQAASFCPRRPNVLVRPISAPFLTAFGILFVVAIFIAFRH